MLETLHPELIQKLVDWVEISLIYISILTYRPHPSTITMNVQIIVLLEYNEVFHWWIYSSVMCQKYLLSFKWKWFSGKFNRSHKFDHQHESVRHSQKSFQICVLCRISQRYKRLVLCLNCEPQGMWSLSVEQKSQRYWHPIFKMRPVSHETWMLNSSVLSERRPPISSSDIIQKW